MKRGGFSLVERPVWRPEYDRESMQDADWRPVFADSDRIAVINNTNFPLDVAVFAVNTRSNLGYRVSPIRRLPAADSDTMKKWIAEEKACWDNKAKARAESRLGEISWLSIHCANSFVLPYKSLSYFDRQHQLFLYFAVAPTDAESSFPGLHTPKNMRGCWVETIGVICHRKPVPSKYYPTITISTVDLLSSKTDWSLAPPMCMQGHTNNAWTKGENGLESGGQCRTAGYHH
jgi:hypothetical protein